MRNNLDEIICERNAWLSETDCNKLLNQVRICNGQQNLTAIRQSVTRSEKK
jgi:hypothetical protein